MRRLSILLLLCGGCVFKSDLDAQTDAQVGLSNRISHVEAQVGDIETKIGGNQAGRDIVQSLEDSWQDVVTIIGLSTLLVVALCWGLTKHRQCIHADKAVCRVTETIEGIRYGGLPESRATIDRLIRRIREKAKGPNDPVEKIINRAVKRCGRSDSGTMKGSKRV